MATTIQNSCDVILNSVRASFLNFSSSETPYSLYISIRKSWAKTKGFPIPEIPSDSSSLVSQEDLEKLRIQLKHVQDSNESLKIRYEESANDCEKAYRKVNELETKLKKFELEDDSKDGIIEQTKKENCELQIYIYI